MAGRGGHPSECWCRSNGVRLTNAPHHRGMTMEHYAGIDVSLKLSTVCVRDERGTIVREAKIASDPEALAAWFSGCGLKLTLIGLEAGPLSAWLYRQMHAAGLPVRLIETRHAHVGLKLMPVKTDRNDARGLAEIM